MNIPRGIYRHYRGNFTKCSDWACTLKRMNPWWPIAPCMVITSYGYALPACFWKP
jgi:hypothetical protein